MKRILLFLATNLAVVIVLSVAARLLGIDQYLAAQGGNLGGLLVFAALFGFGGALISLAMSKWIAKRSMGVRVIEQPANSSEQWLVNTVRAQAEQVREHLRRHDDLRLADVAKALATARTHFEHRAAIVARVP